MKALAFVFSSLLNLNRFSCRFSFETLLFFNNSQLKEIYHG
nr:MAG TPA: hypothetical protein [Caudoviricetes sp.]